MKNKEIKGIILKIIKLGKLITIILIGTFTISSADTKGGVLTQDKYKDVPVINIVKSVTPYSKIGLDYMKITNGDKQLAEMLADGEEEFFGNIDAVVEYKGGKKRYKRKSWQENIWKEMVKFLGQGRIFKDQLRMLDVGAPNMLKEFADLDENKYDILESIGEFKKSEERLKKSEERLKKIKAMFGK